MGKLTRKLREADNVGEVGGKAGALFKLIQAGVHVPDGFVITAEAYGSLTPELQQEVLQEFDRLGATFVAVRSSAINEDGSDAAWAGQLDTFLNCTRDNLLEKVEACWQSAESARAKAYAAQKGIESSKVAVIVQAMVQSEVSGVAFSVHPVTQNDQHIIIEAALGLGEAVVSGEVTPDSYVVDKSSGQIITAQAAAQTKKLTKGLDGTTVWQDIEPANDEQKLSNSQIATLAEQVASIEKLSGFPVDIEWAACNGQLYILQSRPITTLFQV